MKRNWKTTILGVISIVSAVSLAAKALLDGDPATNPDWGATWTAIVAGFGLIVARDFNVSGGGAPVPPPAP